MSRVRIDAVVLAEPLPAGIERLRLERPVPGGEWSGATFEVSGSMRRSGAGRRDPIALEVRHGRRSLRKLKITRDEWPEGDPSLERFEGLVTTLGLPAAVELDLLAVGRDGRSELVARIVGERTPLSPGRPPELRPLAVTAFDSAASARLLALLGGHPQIVALRSHTADPNGARPAHYWLQVLTALAAPGPPPVKGDGDPYDGAWNGANPYFVPELAREPRPGRGLYVERVADLCRRTIESWYAELARDQVKDDARLFAEGFAPGALLALASELFGGVHEIGVVRDPRAWIAVPGRDGAPFAARLQRRWRSAFRLFEHWRSHRDRLHFVSFEELRARPEETLSELMEQLGLDASAGTIETMLAEAEVEEARLAEGGARRGAGVEAGEELSAADARLAIEAFAAPLAAFGYDERARRLPADVRELEPSPELDDLRAGGG